MALLRADADIGGTRINPGPHRGAQYLSKCQVTSSAEGVTHLSEWGISGVRGQEFRVAKSFSSQLLDNFDHLPESDQAKGMIQAANGEKVELAVLMSCLNEAETVATCVRKAARFMAYYGIAGEILIAGHGSTDGSQLSGDLAGARQPETPAAQGSQV